MEAGNGSSGGGLGKWLREHLGGGSKGGQDSCVATKMTSGVAVESPGNEKPFGKTIYTSQNLYCSLPRDHGRHAYNGGRKAGHGNSVKLQGHDRQRCASVNHHEKITFSDLGTLTRGGPIYGSEGKTLKKRNRDRRRHSLNEIHEQGRQRRKRWAKILINSVKRTGIAGRDPRARQRFTVVDANHRVIFLIYDDRRYAARLI